MTLNLLVLDSPELWKGIAFFISVGLVVFPVYRFLIKAVRVRSKQIASRFEEALKLHREAENILKSVQHKNFYRDTKRKQILQGALKDARALKQVAKTDLEVLILRREKENEERICLIRENGLKELKDKVLEIAVGTTQDVLCEKASIESQKALMSESMKDLEAVLLNPSQIEQLKKTVEFES